MEKNMNDIIENAKELKGLILESREYKSYEKMTKKLDKNKEINKIISDIKIKQQQIVKTKDNTLEEELNILFNKLYSYKEYNDYIDSSKKLNDLITKIKNNFEVEFNDILN